MSYNSTTYATLPLALMAYKYSELQMSFATQFFLQGLLQNTPFSHNDSQ